MFPKTDLFYRKTVLQQSINADVEILSNCFSDEINEKVQQFLKSTGMPQTTLKWLFDHLTARSKLPSPTKLFNGQTVFKQFEKPQYKQHQEPFMTELYKNYENLAHIKEAQDACYFTAYVSFDLYFMMDFKSFVWSGWIFSDRSLNCQWIGNMLNMILISV